MNRAPTQNPAIYRRKPASRNRFRPRSPEGAMNCAPTPLGTRMSPESACLAAFPLPGPEDSMNRAPAQSFGRLVDAGLVYPAPELG